MNFDKVKTGMTVIRPILSVIGLCVFVLFGVVNVSGTQSFNTSRPNFVVIFIDDIGWGDLTANWNPYDLPSDTPFLDSLANDGIRFRDFHAAASVCTPSRASLLTGRLGKRTGVITNFGQNSVGGLPLNETTFAETFKAAGYRTGMIGKWHLGVNGKYHPIHRGFDFYYGLPYSNDMGCLDNPGQDIPSCAPCPKDRFHQKYTDPPTLTCDQRLAVPLYKGLDIIEQPVNLTSLSERYAEQANSFLREKSSKPFLLYAALTHMHVPLETAAKYKNSSQAKGIFGDTLREMDGLVQAIVEGVRAVGQESNTLIWITGDNGPWEEKCYLAGINGPFAGYWQKMIGGGGSSGKMTVWEGGHREPAIAYWPGTIAPNQISGAILSTMDIYPTMASIAGIPMPGDRHYDGQDISDVLFHSKDIKDRVLFHPNSGAAGGTWGDFDAVRVGDYKAVYRTGGLAQCHGIQGHQMYHDPPLIFNLPRDALEGYPLSTNSSEYQTVYRKIKEALSAIDDDIAQDNTTIADYSYDQSVRPCCNKFNVVCRCYGWTWNNLKEYFFHINHSPKG